MKRRGRNSGAMEVDMTPMIDIVFQLLIFFMVATTFAAQAGIKVNLPKAISGTVQPERKLTVTITESNRVYLNEEEVTVKALGRKLEAALQGRRDKTLIIMADKKVFHGKVVRVMDIANTSGVERLAFATEVGQEE